MTRAEQRAAFVVRASYDDFSDAARQQLMIRVLDKLGRGVDALDERLESGEVQDDHAGI